MDADFDDQVTRIAALGEPIRRDLFRFVAAQPGPVNREQAAAGIGVAHHVAKFHLDKLVEEGLLEVEYARPPGRGGPGAGRPAKLYRRTERDVSVSIPAREYELAGRILAEAVVASRRDEVPIERALQDAARTTGQTAGRRARDDAGGAESQTRLAAAATEALRQCGYEPRGDGSDVTLANCPFHALAQDYTELVCDMNLHFIQGLVDGLEAPGLRPRLDPGDGRCCVRLTNA